MQIRPLSRLNQDIYSRLEQIKKVKDVIEKAHVAVEARSSWVSLLNDLQSRLIAVEDVWLDQLKLARPDEARPPARGQARVAQPEAALKLRLEGRLIGGNDLWIGCAAKVAGMPLATANAGEFGRIPGLEVIDYRKG